MENNLTALNNYLFEQIERINDDSLSEEKLNREIKRSDAVNNIAKTIIENGNLALKTMRHMDEYGYGDKRKTPIPVMLEVK